MNGMRSLSPATDSQSRFSRKRSRTSVLEIDSWMPFDVELALREALENAVVHGNQEDPDTQVHVRCRCQPGKEISIVVTDQGKGFDFEKTVGNGITTDPDSEHGRGIQLMKAYMDDVHFERGGSEVHMRKRARNTSRS